MMSSEGELGYCIERQLVGRAQPVIDALRAAGLSVATAESCTAGLVAGVPRPPQNARDCLHGGFALSPKANQATGAGAGRDVLLRSGGGDSGEVVRRRARWRSPDG